MPQLLGDVPGMSARTVGDYLYNYRQRLRTLAGVSRTAPIPIQLVEQVRSRGRRVDLTAQGCCQAALGSSGPRSRRHPMS